ncbi:chaperonin 10-like protein [Aspergillus cavernicola]|uniref:Chaperonin 10-like protein n=1 Tax=Aspergillus cavernicola TaxID=176166 RepID=A0ABR4IFA9_9EURO
MATTTQAIIARDPKDPDTVNWSLEVVDVHPPADGEILVEIRATGICHTDLVLSSVPEGTFGVAYPKVVGHEGAGVVRALGHNVESDVRLGDPVLLSYYSCGECRQCQRLHPAYCDAFPKENYTGRQGRMRIKGSSGRGEDVWSRFFGQSSFARHSVVSQTSIVNVRDLLRGEDELKLFAPLGCGFQTGMGAILNYAAVGRDDAVMILGLGAVGMGALMTAKIQHCRTIIVVDRVEARLELASDLGATHTINSACPDFGTLTDAVFEISPGGVSAVIDTTGAPALIEEAFQCIEKRGKLILIGVPPLGYEFTVDVTGHINKKKKKKKKKKMRGLEESTETIMRVGHDAKEQVQRAWDGFLDFAARDNVLEVALGLIIAQAFTSVVNSFVSDIVLPIISLLPFLNRNMDEKFAVLSKGPHYHRENGYNTLEQARDDGALVLAYGMFLENVLNFLGLSMTLYALAQLYMCVSRYKIIKPTVKCQYCQKWISEKVWFLPYFEDELLIRLQALRCVNCSSWQDGREEMAGS